MADDDASADGGCSAYELRFVEAYMGDAHCVGTRAVQLVSPDVQPNSAASMAYEMLRRPHVQRALRERSEHDPLVAGRLERLRWLTSVLRGEVTEVRTIITRMVKGGKHVTEQVSAPPSIADRMAAAAALSKAAGEHLPKLDGDDDVMGKLMALLHGATIPQLMALVSGAELPKGETRQ